MLTQLASGISVLKVDPVRLRLTKSGTAHQAQSGGWGLDCPGVWESPESLVLGE